MQIYLFDVKLKDTPPTADRTSKMGTSLDIRRQELSLTQAKNGDDCRVFTLFLNLPALQAVQISRSTHDQHIVIQRQVRRSIASALMKANKITPTGSVVNHMIWQRHTVTLSIESKKEKREESYVALGKSKL